MASACIPAAGKGSKPALIARILRHPPALAHPWTRGSETRRAPARPRRLGGRDNHCAPCSFRSNSPAPAAPALRVPTHFGIDPALGAAVCQDLCNDQRLLDAGDDRKLAAAAGAVPDLDAKHTLQASCPRPSPFALASPPRATCCAGRIPVVPGKGSGDSGAATLPWRAVRYCRVTSREVSVQDDVGIDRKQVDRSTKRQRVRI